MDCRLTGSFSMGFPRQEYWSGLPFPSPGDLPDPGIKPWSPALQADSLPSEPQGSPKKSYYLSEAPCRETRGRTTWRPQREKEVLVRNKTRPFVLATQCPRTNEPPVFPHQGIKHMTEPLFSDMRVPGDITKSTNTTRNLSTHRIMRS